MNNIFLTGCDSKTEWMLPWFLENYHKHNKSKLVIADFGMTPKMLKKLDDYEIVPFQNNGFISWSLKPFAMMKVKADRLVWLDTDCEILGSIDGIFNELMPGKLNMVEDKPWTSRRGETWHNSGVVGIVDKPMILKHWMDNCLQNLGVGDQEVLHAMLSDPLSRLVHIHDLPNKYNWLRIQLLDGQDSHKKLIMHWTGAKGKDEIKRKMR